MTTSEPQQNETPTATLKAEHQVILRVVDVMERLAARATTGAGFEVAAFEQFVEFIQLFADACHHAKEEDLLFPALEKAGIPKDGGPIGVMLDEHRMARGITATMSEGLKAWHASGGDSEAQKIVVTAAEDYAALLRNHIYKEDNILFNMGDQMLPAEVQTSLCSQFCEVGCREFGGKKRDELARIADDLEEQWPAPTESA